MSIFSKIFAKPLPVHVPEHHVLHFRKKENSKSSNVKSVSTLHVIPQIGILLLVVIDYSRRTHTINGSAGGRRNYIYSYIFKE